MQKLEKQIHWHDVLITYSPSTPFQTKTFTQTRMRTGGESSVEWEEASCCYGNNNNSNNDDTN